MAIGCKIIRDIERPDSTLVKQFRDLPVANIDDAMGRMGAVDAAIHPVNNGFLLGTALTVRLPEGDNLMFHAAMDLARPGDVIVIDAGGFIQRAIFGELMSSYCKVRGVRGIVCDGAIRDVDGISRMKDFPVYARAVTPNGPYKNGPGEINVPVVIGGKIVYPGDIVVGDRDGVIFIRPGEATALADAARAISAKEDRIMEDVLQKHIYPRPWVEEKLREIGCEAL